MHCLAESLTLRSVVDETKPRLQGSARDHLANERTFLAWVRTALGLIGLGVLLERFAVGGDLIALIGGVGLMAFGAGCLLYALMRYRAVTRCLEEGSFPISRRGPLALGIGALVMAVAAMVGLSLGWI